MELNFAPVLESWRFLAGGLYITILLSLSVAACSMVFGTLVALGRRYGPNWLRVILVFYIDSMRAIPVLVVLVWFYFAFPIATGINLPPFVSALVALSLNLTAYVAEIVRAGIESVRPGQVRAGLALGNVLTLTVKDTAIATVIAVPELMRRADAIAGQSYTPVEVFTTVMFLYFLILFPITRGVDLLYRRIGFLGRS